MTRGTTRTPPVDTCRARAARSPTSPPSRGGTVMTGPLRSSLIRVQRVQPVAVMIRLNTVQQGDHGQGRLSCRSRRGGSRVDRRIEAHSKGRWHYSSVSRRGARCSWAVYTCSLLENGCWKPLDSKPTSCLTVLLLGSRWGRSCGRKVPWGVQNFHNKGTTSQIERIFVFTYSKHM